MHKAKKQTELLLSTRNRKPRMGSILAKATPGNVTQSYRIVNNVTPTHQNKVHTSPRPTAWSPENNAGKAIELIERKRNLVTTPQP